MNPSNSLVRGPAEGSSPRLNQSKPAGSRLGWQNVHLTEPGSETVDLSASAGCMQSAAAKLPLGQAPPTAPKGESVVGNPPGRFSYPGKDGLRTLSISAHNPENRQSLNGGVGP